MHLLALALPMALVGAACVKVKEFQFEDAGSLSSDDATDADVGEEGAIARVEGDHVVARVPGLYALHFSKLGYHFPNQLLINNVQVLGSGGATCRDERGVGVAYDPLTVISGAALGGSSSLPDIKIVVAGPPVAKVQLDWAETTTTCSGVQPSGRTTFTFFPDGRITRMDIARVGGPTTAPGCECGGAAATEWKVWGYTTLDPTQVASIFPSGKPSGTNQVIPTTVPVCATGNGDAWRVAFGWFAGGPARELEYVDSTAIAVKAELRDPAIPLTTGNVGDIIANMWIGGNGTADTCSMLLGRIDPYNGNRGMNNLTDMGPGFGLGFAQDGTYGGETSQDNNPGAETYGGFYEVTPNGNPIPGFALWLDFTGYAGNTYRVTKDGTELSSPGDYREQRVVDGNNDEPVPGERIFWFPDGLEVGQHIRVEAMQ